MEDIYQGSSFRRKGFGEEVDEKFLIFVIDIFSGLYILNSVYGNICLLGIPEPAVSDQ